MHIHYLALNLHVHTKWLLQSKNHEYLLYRVEGGITGSLADSFLLVYYYMIIMIIRTRLKIY